MSTRREQDSFQVGPETWVSFAYDLYDAEGDLIETSSLTDPCSFIFGMGQMIPAVERAIEGMGVGQVRRVKLQPQAAYGHRDEGAVIEVERSELPADVALGDELSAENEAGERVHLKVIDLAEDRAVLDTNHPLAGQRVELDVTVEAVWPASTQDLERAAKMLEQSAGAGVQSLLPAERLLKRQASRYEGEVDSDPTGASSPKSSGTVVSTVPHHEPESDGGFQ